MNIIVKKDDFSRCIRLPLNDLVQRFAGKYNPKIWDSVGELLINDFNDASLEGQLQILKVKEYDAKTYENMNEISRLFVKGQLASINTSYTINSAITPSVTEMSGYVSGGAPCLVSNNDIYFRVWDGLKLNAEKEYNNKQEEILVLTPMFTTMNGYVTSSNIKSFFDGSDSESSRKESGNISLDRFYSREGRLYLKNGKVVDNWLSRNFLGKDDKPTLSLDIKVDNYNRKPIEMLDEAKI